MPKRPSPRLPEHPAEKRVRELEDELYFARRTLIDMLGADAQGIFVKTPCRSISPGEVYAWFELVMGRVLEIARPLSPEERTDQTYDGDRARCPLCGGSANDYYNPNNGFAYPEGLRRHLLGANNNRQCNVSREILAHERYVGSLPTLGEWHSNTDV